MDFQFRYSFFLPRLLATEEMLHAVDGSLLPAVGGKHFGWLADVFAFWGIVGSYTLAIRKAGGQFFILPYVSIA